jgi:6-phosphofructokinase 1
MKLKIANEGRVILRSESTEPAVYSTPFIAGMLRAEGRGLFDSRETVLGHLQQGDTPSPLDRIRATRLAVKSMDWLQKVFGEIDEIKDSSKPFASFTMDDNHSCLVGIKGSSIDTTPVKMARAEADLKRRVTKKPWWMSLRPVIR